MKNKKHERNILLATSVKSLLRVLIAAARSLESLI